MSRDGPEFTGKTKDNAFKRSNGICECGCGLPLVAPNIEYDHILPLALRGDASLANCRAVRSECHKLKTAKDVKQIRKADRQRRAHIGAKPAAKQQIKSPGFARKERTPIADKMAHLKRREMYGATE